MLWLQTYVRLKFKHISGGIHKITQEIIKLNVNVQPGCVKNDREFIGHNDKTHNDITSTRQKGYRQG